MALFLHQAHGHLEQGISSNLLAKHTKKPELNTPAFLFNLIKF